MNAPAHTAIPYHPHAALSAAMQACPLVAILRGVRPGEVVAIGHALVEAGFAHHRGPAEFAGPFDSIRALRDALPAEVQVGAGDGAVGRACLRSRARRRHA